MNPVVAGGGVAGAAAACLLGPGTLLLERERAAHDKICGDFISAEAHPYLARLGLDLDAMGAAPIRAVRLVHGDRVASGRLPFTAFGLSRRRLDEALLERAAARGATILRGHTIRSVEDGAVQVAGLGAIPTPRLFLATGKHDLRGAKRELRHRPEDLVGLKMYLSLSPAQTDALRSHIEVILLPGGYAGLQLVEHDIANLCLLLPSREVAAAGRMWAGIQAVLERCSPHLARCLDGARTRLDRPLSISRVPYGFTHQAHHADPAGIYRIGDQMAVTPSFSGDGIAMALHTAFAAVAAERAGGPAQYHRTVRQGLASQIRRALWLQRLTRTAPHLAVIIAQSCPPLLPWAARLTRLAGGGWLSAVGD